MNQEQPVISLHKPLYLQAIFLEENVLRDYIVYLQKDLFGFFQVELYYGRIGRSGQKRSYGFEKEEDARHFAHKRLKQKLRRRKGRAWCYHLIDQTLV